MKQWYESLFENYAHKYDKECFVQGTIGECDFVEKESVLTGLHRLQVCVQVLRALCIETRLLALGQNHLQGRNDLFGDVVLYGKEVFKIPIVPFGPEVMVF